ncbi:ACP S-malonyltransferase [Actinacidiphila acididurans]|uniref:ACP S-malonyltransferase n=1 Tax=Actinacidiphila acididurans TaxID=2784346 RepID=A0ABS2TIN7_9ACTN|nr:ACP S-malonyltransferase [Actinacidiphila acididurans]MBM9503204.1 ACP S-malonyltransferase [Actinacidiphila acididurans]
MEPTVAGQAARDRPGQGAPGPAGRSRIAGFFPGLGSRAAYQNLDRSLLDCGMPEVERVYQLGARALGRPGRPETLLMVPENMPATRMERQGFIGAAFLVHSLALEAYLRAAAHKKGVALDFTAYTGESFGVIASAVASGSVSVGDGVRIARAFTPLMLLAAEGGAPQDALSRDLAAYLPDPVRGRPLAPEPYHVVALRGEPDDLTEALKEIEDFYPRADVEVHKLYSRQQTNIYVRLGVKSGFDLFMQRFPAVATEELKEPTTFLAHSARMRAVRRGLERFIEENNIVFRRPRVPLVSNSGAGLLTTAAEVRGAVLAVTDEVMASRITAETLDALRPDAVVELGLGEKSVRLLTDNNIETPVTACTGDPLETEALLDTVHLAGTVTTELAALRRSGTHMTGRHHDLLRRVFRRAQAGPFHSRYLHRSMSRVVADEMLRPQGDGAPAFRRFLEVYQYTRSYHDSVDAAGGELVLRARLKKRITGPAEKVGQVYAELKVLDAAGGVADRSTLAAEHPEVVVVHLSRLSDLDAAELARRTRLLLDTQPVAHRIHDQISESLWIDEDGYLPLAGVAAPPDAVLAMSRFVYQYTLFEVLRLHRPAIFAQSDHYIAAGDPLGWLVALAASGAVPLATFAELYADWLRAGARTDRLRPVLDRLLSALRGSEIPVISPDGVPLQSRKDLEAATRAVLGTVTSSAGTNGAGKVGAGPNGAGPNGTGKVGTGTIGAGTVGHGDVHRVHLNGNCQIVSLGSELCPARVDAGPHRASVVSVLSPAELWTRGVNPALDAFEDRCAMGLTEENERVLRHAQGRRLLSSSVNAYVGIGEPIVGFGKGGSESMTIFLTKGGDPADRPYDRSGDGVTVRKVLSEALTTARWSPDGTGVMLPPFAKAKKQAEFLRALPEPVRRYFPEVHDVLERDIPVPAHLRRGGRTTYREVVYEMSYVRGEEVSRFVEKHSPPPAVVARLYEEIMRLLDRRVHSVNRVPAPGDTLEASYFRKIEDRLALCRRTAPHTFGPGLLDTERIVIDGRTYLNQAALLRRFREHPRYLEILEPRFHSLVMGDTNTENIKLSDPEPLLRAQRLIESGAPRARIDAALAAITAESLGIRFLDPRAIGFRSDGAETRDDPMYDNKPWHNSIGHYDEIHYEQFALRVDVGAGRVPRVDVDFTKDNAYQRSYRVRDVAARRGRIGPGTAPHGVEDHFAPVMTAVYGLDDPDSPYLRDDPYWLIRFVFMMGTHFTAMPPFHFQAELDGTLTDTYQTQRRPVAIYCQGIKWLNWALEMLEGRRREFLGLAVPPLPAP